MTKIFRSNKGFTLIELMIVVAIIAILAVVAVPQFTKYMRTAKTAEANEMLDLIKKGSAAYYTTPRSNTSGGKIACQFPQAASATPVGAITCCLDALDSDNDERCDSNSGAWNHVTWSALKFAMTDQHYFRYQYESSGTLDTASYTASAYGDLDCDTTQSTFKLAGYGDPKATAAECDFSGASAIFRDNETE